MTATTKNSTSGVTLVLRAFLLVLLIALVVPALALADDTSTGVLDPPTLETPSPAAENPQTESPAPAQTTPVVDVQPEPTTPPAATTPDPVAETPAEPVAPPETEVIPAPAPAAPPEVVITTPELVATPATGPDDAAAKLLPVVVIPPSNADTPSRTADIPPSLPGNIAGAAALTSSITLAAATDRPVTLVTGPAGDDSAGPSASTLQGLLTKNSALHQDLFTLDPGKARSPVAPVGATTIDRGPGMPFGEEGESTLFSESVGAPIGTATSGSSLLAVLAGYVLPGVGGPPASTLIMFVLVGLIVAIARAPRPQLSERLHMGALLGAASGHGLAVCRPG